MADVMYSERIFGCFARIEKALDIATQYGGIDGGHHKTWIIDQMVRALTGENYEQWVKDYQGKYDEELELYEYEWECGIAP
jgi:hypothetical protein